MFRFVSVLQRTESVVEVPRFIFRGQVCRTSVTQRDGDQCRKPMISMALVIRRHFALIVKRDSEMGM